MMFNLFAGNTEIIIFVAKIIKSSHLENTDFDKISGLLSLMVQNPKCQESSRKYPEYPDLRDTIFVELFLSLLFLVGHFKCLRCFAGYFLSFYLF